MGAFYTWFTIGVFVHDRTPVLVFVSNWLRDYSQAVDIAGLKKLQLQTIINLCMALGFLAHGYATHEFEVTEERLGVYLPVRPHVPPTLPLILIFDCLLILDKSI